ncbi:MAG TPA: alpha/beta fold hydrolase [Candidatus Dormibacteraeota bacterium]|nr:alpha/beta fold hydrolase [Candidatus Dormibacteraeota bacterium]
MSEPQATVLIPGLLCSARLYAEQIPALWRFGPVAVADHTRHHRLDGIARQILASAPPRFALVGLSMGGYLAFEILRQAPQRVAKLALLDTVAYPERPEQTERRRAQIELARQGRLDEVCDLQLPLLVHPARLGDRSLEGTVRLMAEEVGPEAFLRQQAAIMGRPDSRPDLPGIRCPTLVLVGDGDQLTPPDQVEEMAAAIPGARLVVVPDCGHLSPMERPAEVTEALVGWLREGTG